MIIIHISVRYQLCPCYLATGTLTMPEIKCLHGKYVGNEKLEKYSNNMQNTGGTYNMLALLCFTLCRV